MKTLYININNEQIQSNEEFEVLKHDLDSDFFFYLGEKIVEGCKVENENSLITDFNTQDNKEDYKQIIAQWNDIKTILFSEECEGEFEFTLPNGYIHWLRYNEKYNHVYDKNFSHGEPCVISIDLEELYEESVEDMQRKVFRTLKRNDLYLEIDEIVFNDDVVTRKSPIIHTIKEKYEGVGFKAYKKWLQDNEDKPHTTPQVCGKCGKNPCECNTLSDNFFPYKDISLGKTPINEINEYELFDDGSIVAYDLDDGVSLCGVKKNDYFIAALVDSTESSNNKLPKEWCNILGCKFGTFHEKCRRALGEKDFEIILDEDEQIVVVSPSKRYRIHLIFDVNTSKFKVLMITLNECPYCKSNNLTLRKINGGMHTYCTDCNRFYLPVEEESDELDEAEENEMPICPNCSSDDVDDDGSDYLQYTCNDCGHNWGHDDTVECPACGSDNVENNRTDNQPYTCNVCGCVWGCDEDTEQYDSIDEEDYDDETDSAGNQMSEYLESFGFSSDDVKRKGKLLCTDLISDRYEMPNGIHVELNKCHDCIEGIIIYDENSIPQFYKNLGIYWEINQTEFRGIFENLGFYIKENEDGDITAYKKCMKWQKEIYIDIIYMDLEIYFLSVKFFNKKSY